MTDEKPQRSGILEGTIAQILGGAIGVFIASTLASFDIYMKAGWESSFGTICGISLWLGFHKLRRK